MKRLTQRYAEYRRGSLRKSVLHYGPLVGPFIKQSLPCVLRATLRASALILCLCFFSFLHFCATWRFSYIYCLIHATSPGHLRARGGGGDTAATPGIPVRGSSAAFKRVQSAPAAAHAESVLPPANSMRSPSAWLHPAGLGAGVLQNPRFVFFFGKEMGLTPACNAAGPLCTSGRNKVRG